MASQLGCLLVLCCAVSVSAQPAFIPQPPGVLPPGIFAPAPPLPPGIMAPSSMPQSPGGATANVYGSPNPSVIAPPGITPPVISPPGISPQPPSISPPPATSTPCTAGAISEGNCNINTTLFSFTPMCSISVAIMFDRTPGLTCDECQNYCGTKQDANSPWICRALTYDHRWQICDLFAISDDASKFPLVSYPGRDYLKVVNGPGVAALG